MVMHQQSSQWNEAKENPICKASLHECPVIFQALSTLVAAEHPVIATSSKGPMMLAVANSAIAF